ncbi:biotin/lipoyl-containing protein [Maridesulfovibrio sp.]|uniref:biotin/lipoyl-containing protein n=1 Tax=Maridesulfovibrio sp. TaxID=2795000 RepID=UPI002A18D876|nr:biotin/lipoyl-containing protein [Maridesulfovibrio sp.]
MTLEIKIPRLNANEDELLVSDIFVSVGDQVSEGDLLFAIESVKSSVEIDCQQAGFINQINIETGEYYEIGFLAMTISSDRNSTVQAAQQSLKQEAPPQRKEKITAKKRLEKITTLASRQMRHKENVNDGRLPVIIIGGGDHAGKLSRMIDKSFSFRVLGYVGPALDKKNTNGLEWLGTDENLAQIARSQGSFAALAAGVLAPDAMLRSKVYAQCLSLKIPLPVFVHPTAEVDPSAVLEPGVQIFANATVGANVTIKAGSIINTGAIISHDSSIGQLTHIAPGAVLAGRVAVGDRCIIGMNSTIYIGVNIPDSSIILNNSNISKDIR